MTRGPGVLQSKVVVSDTAPEARGPRTNPFLRPAAARYLRPRGRFAGAAALAAVLFLLPAGPAPAADVSSLKPWTEGARPSFTLNDLAGQPRSLDEFAGKVVLLHFFATWCVPCVDEITSLKKLVTQTRGQPLAVVAVDVAEVELRVRAFFEKLPVDFPVLLDRDRAVTKAWEVYGLPSTFVLDAALAPKLFVEGDLDWSHPEILKQIEALYPAAVPSGPRAGG